MHSFWKHDTKWLNFFIIFVNHKIFKPKGILLNSNIVISTSSIEIGFGTFVPARYSGIEIRDSIQVFDIHSISKFERFPGHIKA